MKFRPVTYADWRAQVDKELAGAPFERALVTKTAEGLAIEPLYTELPPDLATRDAGGGRFAICTRPHAKDGEAGIAAELDGGADGVWVGLGAPLDAALKRATPPLLVLDPGDAAPAAVLGRVASLPGATPVVVALDPLARRARGLAPFTTLAADLAALAPVARAVAERAGLAAACVASTLPYHDAGADAADEIAIALSTGALYLGALLDADVAPADAARAIAFQVAVGRDTFVELAKIRALRTCWAKVAAAAGIGAVRPVVHAVGSARTLTVRDPWVNMLRGTTQVFAGVLGGADVVTPTAFDDAFDAPSDLGLRVARNTGLVLREESHLGRVVDPAGGSYYLETVTGALAREAWKRFRELEAAGGASRALESGKIAAKLESARAARAADVAKRKAPILGVSEFANLTEKLPGPAPAPASAPAGLPLVRDAAAFERLRARADGASPEVLLLTLGPRGEAKARAAFASNLFAAGGLRSREGTSPEGARCVCICGTDERYASDAAAAARALKAAGAGRVLLAGRPGALEAPLREAGVDAFIFMGCDAVAVLTDLLADPS